MQITQNTVATFFYRLTNEANEEVENNYNNTPMAYLHGHNNIFPALEAALEGLTQGDEKTVPLSATQAYGPRRPNTAKKVPMKHLLGKPKKLVPGQLVKVNTEKGAIDASVIKAGKFMIEVDFNHPLAGQDLTFHVKIHDVREATQEEIAHGHAHGVGGHHH